ncbi:stage V sporulation protein K [Bacillus carboniphilus]|uniref:Stage V sporulation protein K n=1 Tax=Bacillus carboniphilus TaxID=86663 RepID=A0ABY9JVM6_9BACI|nr:stage V sporulation protein K [Bacillus carboniphilus]WLR43464.1 stage V sporulation protein K [Bacillus carboniphilus]
MDEPITYKSKGQINIVINGHKQNTYEELTSYDAVPSTVQDSHSILKEIEKEMSSLVGMEQMKETMKEIYAWIYVNQKRQEQGLKAEKQALHMLFKGNPGTGKTTVARLIGKLFYKMEVLSKGHLIEAERADLVGEYIGHTAQKTRDLIRKSLGGILFIDEAYSLARGGEKDFGKEAIDTLVKHMEDHKDEFVLILAGYSREMEYFLSLNPGLHSRFPLVVDFPDYTVNQLLEIARTMLDEREYIFHKEAEWKLKAHLLVVKEKLPPAKFSNGRYVRNIIEKSIRKQALRLLSKQKHEYRDLMTIHSEDIAF